MNSLTVCAYTSSDGPNPMVGMPSRPALATLASGLAAFTGDLVFAQGRVAVLDTPDTDVAAMAVETLAGWGRRGGLLFPGPGGGPLPSDRPNLPFHQGWERAGVDPPPRAFEAGLDDHRKLERDRGGQGAGLLDADPPERRDAGRDRQPFAHHLVQPQHEGQGV